MKNLDKYHKILKRDLGASEEDLCDEVLVYNRFKRWESVRHMEIVSDLEEAFDVQFNTLDITSFNKYSAGIEILKKLGVNMDV